MENGGIINSGIKKVAATVLTQALVLGISVVTGFILPDIMGPEKYAYWQIYLFYLAYVNLFGLGFNDGIALFYAGYEYQNLPYERLRAANRLFVIYIGILTCLLLCFVPLIHDPMYRDIYMLLALNLPLVCFQCIVLTVVLAVNRTGIYNLINIALKVLSTVFIIVIIVAGITSSSAMMRMDLVARAIITVVCLIIGRQIFFGKTPGLHAGLKEFWEKAKAGINITIAFIASNLMPLTGRIIIEWKETKINYGLFSFAMTLLTVILTFASTAGTVIFPIIKRLREDTLSAYYLSLSLLCNTVINIALLLYMPLMLIIQLYMEEYRSVLAYLPFLFTMCLPLGKIQLLLTPYYKALRRERAFLFANLAGVAGMFLFTILAYDIFGSVTAVAVCSALVITVWMVVAEFYLLKRMDLSVSGMSLMQELMMMAVFVIAGLFQNAFYFLMIYGTFLLVYLLFNRKQIIKLYSGVFRSKI